MRNINYEAKRLAEIIESNSHYRHYAVDGEWVRNTSKIEADCFAEFGKCIIRMPLGFLIALLQTGKALHIQAASDGEVAALEGIPVIGEGTFVVEKYHSGDFCSYRIAA